MPRFQIRIETLYLLTLAALNTITCYLVLEYGFYGSAVLFKSVDKPEDVWTNLAVLLAGYACLYAFMASRREPHARPRTHHDRLDAAYSLIIGVNWLIFLTTGIGVAGTSAQSLGFLVNMLPMAPLLLVYFADRERNVNTHYLVNLATGSLLIMLRGWSAIVVVMVIILVLSRIRVVNARNAPKIVLAAGIMILAYNYLYLLKYYIREGVLFESNFLVTAEYAISRVTAFQNFDYFSSIVPDFLGFIDGDALFYIKEFLLAFLPKSMIGYENYRPLDNIFATQFIAPGIDGMEGTGFAVTLPGIFRLATELSPLNALIFPVFALCLYGLIFVLCKPLWSPRIKYYFIITALNLYYSGNMREFAFCIYALVLHNLLCRLDRQQLRSPLQTSELTRVPHSRKA
ncbi:hypothetical protein EIP75_10675 [Aquabacterium soli]|uniref:Oligosaccharide repeat unit polymerase n=1 Tax=Aquabacterium soli TaxID=2493092 RepID=A0A426VBM6_9BURK|nr:oligosaccharide repeat unit polymerase [Aquabacterium soli]RRS04349.1 hypothetical protein EIP75_10675 [Aquabacterium soli]